MSNEQLLLQANRESGDWLPNVHICPMRVKPCGNPRCCDEAMRGGQQLVIGGFIERLKGDRAIVHAHKIADSCGVDIGQCPLEYQFGVNRHVVIDQLIATFLVKH